MSKEVRETEGHRNEVRVSDLKDQIGTPGPHPFLYCAICAATYSANKGDYFMHPADYVFTCCEENMKLYTSRMVYEEVDL
jgi:hypothetical protein